MKKTKVIAGTPPLFAPESDWVAPNLSDLPDWRRAKRVAIDTEFEDKTLRTLGIGARRGAKIVGYSFMLEGDRPYYVPVRHPSGNVDAVQGMSYLRDNLGSFEGELIGANMNVDLDVLHYEDVRPNYDKVVCQDVQVRQPLIWELDHRYNLEAIAGKYGYEGKDESLLKSVARDYGFDVTTSGWKACISHLPAKYVGPYGEQDVRLLLPIYWDQQKIIDAQGLQTVVDLEASILPLLLKMRQKGIRIDFDHLDRVEAWARAEEEKTVAEIKRLTGIDIGYDCMAANRVAPVFQELGIEIPKTETGQWSIKSDWLATIEHPVAQHVRYTRQVNKLRTTFVESIRSHQVNGRIHTTFRQVVGASENNETSGAAFGRLSSSNPNLQQQPSRGPFASFWRQIYLPEEGMRLCSSDVSAQEPRWAVHFAEVLGLRGAAEMAEMYRTDKRIDPHDATSKITGLKRKDAKTVLLAQLYGEGDSKLCHHQLNLPTRFLVQTDRYEKYYFESQAEALRFRHGYQGKCKVREVAGIEAQAILDKFNENAPFFKELARRVSEKVEKTGILKLVGGRHIHFPLEKDGSWGHTYKALNRLIQGQSAYQIKLALLAVDKEFPDFLQLQIHDELVGSVPDIATGKRISEIMEGVVKARIPWRCEVEIGPNFGQMKVVCNEKKCTNFADPVDKWGCQEHALKKELV